MSFLPSEILENIQSAKQTEDVAEYHDFILDENTMKLTAIGNQKESLKEWIKNALRITRYEYSICPYDYGQDFNELNDSSYTVEEKKDLFELYIIETLKVNEYIADVVVENIEINGDSASADIKVKDIFGDEIEYEYNS